MSAASHQSSPVSRIAFILLLFLSVASFLLSALFLHRHIAHRREIVESSKSQLITLTTRATESIDAILRETMVETDTIAGELSSRRLKTDEALRRLKKSLEQNPHAYGGTITFRPYGFDPKRRLYSAYWVKKAGRIEYVQLDTVYDYTKPEYDWFTPAMEKGALWTQPYYDEAGVSLMITYSAPFYETDIGAKARRPLGVVTVDIAMDEIRRIIETLDLGPTGFGALVSERGIYLYHPNTELVIARKSLAEFAREQNDRDRMVLAEKVPRRESGIMDHYSTSTGLSSWLVYAPVPTTGWSLQNTFIKDDLPWDIGLLRRQLIRIVVALTLFLSTTAALIFRAHTGSASRLWVTSAVTAVLILFALGYLWHLALSYHSGLGGDGARISDRATLQNVMNAWLRTCAERHTEKPVFVPTGVFLESAHFTPSDDLSVTGYLWHKYTLGQQDNLSRGFMIADTTSLEITENFRHKEQNLEIVRWYFHALLRVRLDHSRYPLEQEKIGLRILHKDLDHNVVLVPDLPAYRFINATSLPGLEKGLAFSGWQVTQSFFELRNKRFDTDFGIERSITKENFPSLFFNIVIKRNFIDAFISNLTALIIVAILLFTLIMITSRDERLVGFMQAGSGRILNICAAMFLVIAFSHIDIRRKIGAEQVFYLEYFYFTIYVTILAVSINSVVFAMGKRVRFIQFRDNLITKLLYWPFLLLFVFAISVYTFY